MKKFSFEIIKKSKEANMARVGVIYTPHGDIKTPAFINVGTKATVKALTAYDIKNHVGAEALLANTYHLYLQPGPEIVESHGGFSKMMGWNGPTFTDSGGFQVFSLGAAFETGVSKIATRADLSLRQEEITDEKGVKKVKSSDKQMVKIDEDGAIFKSFIDGSSHRFTPEISVDIQHKLGADIFFTFDECTSPLASYDYQVSSMERTHRWAKRCLEEHVKLGCVSSATKEEQALFAVVQGGAYEDLRKKSSEVLSNMYVEYKNEKGEMLKKYFDGYGVGGSFTKDDMSKTVKVATENLPEDKPRHLLGIGEPIDIFLGVEYGIDTFDCVSPTRLARHGNLYTENGRINILNAKYKKDFSPISDDIDCYTNKFTKSYLHHLFKANEILASQLASIHNLYFINNLVRKIRESILEDRFFEYKKKFCANFYTINML